MSDAKGQPPRRPGVFRVEPDAPGAAHTRTEAETATGSSRRPMALPADEVTLDERDFFDIPPDEQAELRAEADRMTPEPATARRRGFSFTKLAAGAFGILLSLAIGLWTDRLVRDLFSRADWLGYLAIAAAVIFVLALLIAVAREAIAIMRLTAIQRLKDEIDDAAASRNAKPARAAVDKVVALTRDKPETARGRTAIDAMRDEIVDGPELIAFAERELMGPLDIKARRLILNAAKRVSVVTAVSPRAVVDIAYVLYESARLIRALATLYGGRPGTLGMMKLFRDVLAHLAVTSSIAIGDSLIQEVVGHGVASRLSSRLGEGVINGLMTARIGIAAMDLCRPMTFRAIRRPGTGDFVADLARLGQDQEKRKARKDG